jgi:pimeloyl-ACP methyl ester carboxylesterase
MQWYYQRKFFEKDFHLILIDLPGMGETQATANRNFSLEQFASDLRAVILHTKPLDPILWGHSIGGMCILTFFKVFPEGSLNIKGIILQHTTYTNPLKTIVFSRLLTKSQDILVRSFSSLMIFFSHAVWLFRWMSHFSGNLMLYNRVFLFTGGQTRQQLYFASRRWASARPAYTARGLLGMLDYDATQVLQQIKVPTLVIGAKQDKLTKYSASSAMADKIPDCRLLTLDPAGHLGLMEQHERVNEGAQKFLKEIHAAVLDPI